MRLISGVGAKAPWAARRAPDRGGAVRLGMISPSWRTWSQPSVCSRTSTWTPAWLGRSVPGSSCRVRHWYWTVLSRATLRVC